MGYRGLTGVINNLTLSPMTLQVLSNSDYTFHVQLTGDWRWGGAAVSDLRYVAAPCNSFTSLLFVFTHFYCLLVVN